MLSSFKMGIITLINNALKGEKKPLPDDFDYSRLYDFAKRQQIIPLLYYGVRHDIRFLSSAGADKLKYAALYSAAVSDHQLCEVEKICAEFDKNGIDYMKLKGTVLKKLYPRSDMRMMGDADILIRESQMKDIEKLMTGFGYRYILVSDHEWMWKKNNTIVELHKRLIPSYTKDFYEYYADGWIKAHKKNVDTSEYIMLPEEEFIYLFVHFAKHYRYNGIGIRHATDIYVFMEKHCDLDMDYVNKSFKTLGIYDFFVNVCRMLDVWFGEGECDEISEFLTNKIFQNGAYGSYQTGKKSQALVLSKGTNVAGAKRKKMINLIFPTYNIMCYTYSWLRGKPLLLPIAWAYRIINVLLFKRDRIKLHRNDMKNINKDVIDSYQTELNFVGLDFNFEV